jgi:hypothetical protein
LLICDCQFAILGVPEEDVPAIVEKLNGPKN